MKQIKDFFDGYAYGIYLNTSPSSSIITDLLLVLIQPIRTISMSLLTVIVQTLLLPYSIYLILTFKTKRDYE